MDVQATITDGSFLLASPLAMVAGLVSFFSPGVLPLLPAYLAQQTAIGGHPVPPPDPRRQPFASMVALLFVAGVAVCFVSAGVVLGGLSSWMLEHQRTLQQVFGGLVTVVGLAHLRELMRMQRVPPGSHPSWPAAVSALLVGMMTGLGWTPSIGPVVGTVIGLGIDQGTASRAQLLAVFYCLGLAALFVALAFGFSSLLSANQWLRSHVRVLSRSGALVLVVIGTLTATGVWNDLTATLQVWINGFTPVL